MGEQEEITWIRIGTIEYAMMGNQPTPNIPAGWPYVLPREGPIDVISPTTKLDKGDYCQLKASKRKFRIVDERKDSDNNFEELCKFDDDSRRPVWLPHTWLVGEVNILEKA